MPKFFRSTGETVWERKQRNLEEVSKAVGRKYKRRYPFGKDLNPQTYDGLHSKLLDYLLQRVSESRIHMEKYYSKWSEVEKTLVSYITLDEKERELKSYDARIPTSIVVPVSYATLDTFLTYMDLNFFDDPMLRYEGTGSESADTIRAIMLEKVVNMMVYKAKMPLDLHLIFRNNFAYGIGSGALFWKEDWGYRTVRGTRKVDNVMTDFMGLSHNIPTVEEADTKRRVKALNYEGSELVALDPFYYYPDPNVSPHRFRESEMIAWLQRDNVGNMIADEYDDQDLFNCEYLKYIDGRSLLTYESWGEDRPDLRGGSTMIANTYSPVDRIVIFAKIIPNDLGLGRSQKYELWCFEIAADVLIIKARPVRDDANTYPIIQASTSFDGKPCIPISAMEQIQGMQGFLNWLPNSRMANVRKALNDMFIIDPQMVNYYDFKNPSPGKIIKLRRTAWGRQMLDQAVKQLNVSDITASHLALDMPYWENMVQKVMATTDPIAGVPRQHTGRVTAEEYRGTQRSAGSRIEKNALLIGIQTMQDLAFLLAKQVQQYMSHSTYVKITGEWEDTLRTEFGLQGDRVEVSPFDLLVDFDVVSKIDTTSGGENLEAMTQVFQVLSQNEALAQQFDMVKIFQVLARKMGFKDLYSFAKNKLPVQQVGDDEKILREAEKGNLVPYGKI